MPQATMTAIYGRRGAGKTTRALALAAVHKRVIVFDPMGEWPGLGYPGVPWGRLGAVLPDRAFRASYKPVRGQGIAALHGLSEALFRMQEGRKDRILLLVDEMSVSFPEHKLANDCQGFKHLCEQGRHYNIDVIGTTQRPATVSTVFKGNCQDTYIFALEWVNDVQAVCAMIGVQHKGLIQGQKDHHFVHYCRGQVALGQNPPKKTKKR